MSEFLQRHTDRSLQGDLRCQGLVVSFTTVSINTNQQFISYILC